jgi:hypothetical protein
MDEDLVRAALRRDSEMLLSLAPRPDAAALWHQVRRARAARLKRIIDICGWSVRAVGAAAALGVALAAPDALPVVLGPLALAAWLSTGICTPILARPPGGP